MRLLLMDTCGASGSVALAEGGAVVAADALPGRSASERLVPAVRLLLEAQGWRLTELAAIAVVHGPGSFTGVRIGVSAAKGLSEAVGVPIVAVSRLEVLAAVAGSELVALDAGRGEFYLRARRAESLATLEELVTAAGLGELAVCEARLAETLVGVLPVRLVPEPAAGDALSIALSRVNAGRFDDAATLDAHYLRRTEGLFGRAVTA